MWFINQANALRQLIKYTYFLEIFFKFKSGYKLLHINLRAK
ncbi:Uncharacterised protein [Phocaeicola vulgatus]|nr:Uncharacterised protein [Phocaeicola vulgatus]SUV49399.1 Uncharacterised protein [Phocaeicola vulgatus]